jgi:hypothetical protein
MSFKRALGRYDLRYINFLLRIGWKYSLAALEYTGLFHAYRKQIHRFMGTKTTVSQFNPLLNTEAHRFLLRVLDSPENLRQYIRTEAGAIILKMVYDYTIEPHKRDPFVDLADGGIEQFSLATVPGAWLVDIMSFRTYNVF